jgi:hypothetical protein
LDNSQENFEKSSRLDPKIYDENGNVWYTVQLKTLFRDKTYVLMFVSTGLMTGVLGGIGNTVNEIVSIWGFP